MCNTPTGQPHNNTIVLIKQAIQHYRIVRIHQVNVYVANNDPADQCNHRHSYHPRYEVTSNCISQLLTWSLSIKYKYDAL